MSGLFAAEDDVMGTITGLNADRELEMSLLELGVGKGVEVVILVLGEPTAGGVTTSCSFLRIWGNFDSVG